MRALQEEPVLQQPMPLFERAPDRRVSDALEALRSGLSPTATALKYGMSVTTMTVMALGAGLSVKLKPKRLKPDLRERIEELLEKDISVPDVASEAGVSLSSVYRVLKSNPKLALLRQKALHEGRLEQARNAWLNIQATESKWNTTKLRARTPAVYSLLYRYDREWLATHAPKMLRSSESPRRRVRTPEGVDELLVRRIHVVLQRLEWPEMPATRTKTRIAALAGRPRYRVSAKTTPVAVSTLLELSESRSEYVVRRLSQATANLRNLGIPLIPWRVVKESGLRQLTVDRSGVNVQNVIRETRAAALRRPRHG
jgi:AraC-like DNA-binding protein